ncbi:MAG TPA: hypothetical protein VME66_00405 [Candidatus Acidoferrales bacterium]|nr:hypothetical protein [Candidatus Acidoferrales bacterium]
MQLRPLSLGELLDRAVTLCVRHVWVLALIFLVFIVPLSILQTYAIPDQTKAWTSLIEMARSGGSEAALQQAAVLSRASSATGATAIWFLVAFFFSPLPYAALILATSQAYLTGTTSFAAAYRGALRVWPRLLGLTFLYTVALVIVGIAAAIVGAVVIVIVVLLGRAAVALGIIAGIVLGGAYIVGMIVLGLVGLIAVYLSYYTCTLEGAPVWTSLTSGVQLAFGRGNFPRSLGAGLAFTAINFGISLVSVLGAGMLFGLVHSAYAGQTFSVLVSLPATAFLISFVTLYYYDLRVRNEGFDLRIEIGAPMPVADA